MANQIMKMADWLDMARDFPTHAEAEQYRQRNGIQIEGEKSVNYSDYGELPPLSQASSLVATQQVAEPEEAVSTMDEEEETGAEDAMGGLDLANLDFSKLRGDPTIFQQILRANIDANKRAEQSAKQLYEEGRKRIMEKYAGPSQSERLFALSRAMLSPTDFPGFKGFLGNVTGALSENAKAQRMAEQAREEQLFNLQQQYQQGAAQRAAALPKTAADLATKYMAATKPTQRRTGFNPITGRLQYMDTGEPVAGGDIPVLTPEQVAALSRDPRNRGMKFKTVDGRQMEIK